MRLAQIPRIIALVSAPSLAVAGLVLAAGSAAAVSQQISYSCEATTGFGPIATALNSTVDATAPETVTAGSAFSVTVTPQADQIPSTVSGLPLIEIRDLALTIPIPVNSTLESATLEGGSGLPGTPVPVVGENAVVITLTGAIAGGAAYQLPALTLNLIAGSEGTVDIHVGGTSLTDPGLTLSAVADVFGTQLVAPTVCFPEPNPVLASTTIVAADPPVEPEVPETPEPEVPVSTS